LKTALHWSIIRGTAEITGVLLEYRPDFNAADIAGYTPVDYALKSNDYKELMRLILHGANPLRCGKKTRWIITGLECKRVLEVFKLFWLKLIFLPDKQRYIIFDKRKKYVIQACNYELEKYQKFGNRKIDSEGF
jgi:ankyrin repeat protein